MKTSLWAAALMLAASAAASAQQSETWADAMDDGVRAYEAQDLDAALAAFERAVTLTDAPFEEAESLRVLAIVRLEQDRPADALALSERAVDVLSDLVAAGDEDAIRQSQELWRLRTDMFGALGLEAEWRAARDAANALFEMLPQPGWRLGDDEVARHFLSGFSCPATVEGFPRTEFVTYSAGDVGCSYGVEPDVPAIITIYFTMLPLDASVDAMKQEIDRAYGSPEVLEDDEIQRSDGVAARRVVYAKGVTRLAFDYSGGWLVDVGGWTAKVRISWGGGLDRAFIDGLADSLSVESTRNVWTDDCAPVTEQAEETSDTEDAAAAAMGAAVMITGTSLLFTGVEDLERPFDPRSVLETEACLIGTLQTSQGEIVARRLRNPQAFTSVVAAPLGWRAGQSWFAVVSTLDSSTFFVSEISPDGATVWAAFNGTPSDQQFGELLAEIVRGERDALAKMSGNAIQISVPEE